MSKAAKMLQALLEKLKPAEEAAGRLRERVVGGSRQAFERNADEVGEVFFDAAMRNPNYFMFGPRFEDDLAAQFGVGQQFSLRRPGHTGKDTDYIGELGRYINPDKGVSDFSPMRSVSTWPEFRAHAYAKSSPLRSMFDPLPDNELARTPPDVLDLMRKQGHRPMSFDRLVQYETNDVPSGTNAGARLYGAAFGELSKDPGAANYSAALTGNNTVRRSFNMVPAIMRDPTLAERILLHPGQLEAGGAPKSLTAADLNRYGAKRLVGALNMLGTQGTLDRSLAATRGNASNIRSYLTNPANAGKADDNQFFLDQMSAGDTILQSILDLERSGGWSDEALANYAKAARGARRELGNLAPTIGEKTARKMGITMRTRTGGDPTSINTDELEFRHGGSVYKDLRSRLHRRKMKR
jgi:hypothetical protein